MPNALVKIKSQYHDFSPGERQIADYILDNADKVPLISVHELAAAVGISVASVSRFAKKLEYGNLKNFKIDLAREAAGPLQEIYQAIKPSDSGRKIADKVFCGTIESLRETQKLLDYDQVIKAAKALAQSKRILFLGTGASGNVAELAALRFSHLNLATSASTDSYKTLLQVLQLQKGDVAVGISHSGRTRTTVEALNLARRNGALTLGISNYKNSPVDKESDRFFCTSFQEGRVHTAALSSTNAQLCIIDTLYLLTARLVKNLGNIEKLNTYAEKTIRIT
ncbi:MAG: MurR/RpiR family transcriptional regulator [Victivallales bacterium]|jgi:DNA-binding MurR/RpiR family transcriptional regulator